MDKSIVMDINHLMSQTLGKQHGINGKQSTT